MLIPVDVIAGSINRLNFDPAQKRAEVSAKSPLDNERAARRRQRLQMAREQGPDAFERIIGGDDQNDLIEINYLERAIAAARAVGRVHVRDDVTGELTDYASGFLISPRLLLTNHHVFHNAGEARNSQVEFNFQLDADNRPRISELFDLRPDEFFATDQQLDFAVVAVAAQSQSGRESLKSFGSLVLNPQVGKVSPGECLTIVQHPGGKMKQIALRNNQLLEIADDFLWYATDTEPGSSGAPVFNDSWQVVALHHSGVPARDGNGKYLTVDGQVWTPEMGEQRIKWVANEGIRVSRLVANLQQQGDHALLRGIFDRAALAPHSARNPEQIDPGLPATINARAPALPPASAHPQLDQAAGNGAACEEAAAAAEDNALILSVPLDLRLRVEGLAVGSAPRVGQFVASAGAAIVDEAISIDPDYSNRQGYDPDFLGHAERVPLPRLSEALQQRAAVNNQAGGGADRYVLPYHHFSIVMNRERMLAMYTAVNIDGSAAWEIERNADRWVRDPRIGPNEQTDNALYANNQLDRGHLVRRLDPAWGETKRLATFANDDTFHFTNCCPQHANFNQSTATWLGLENYILDNAIAEGRRVSVFSGPLLLDDDRTYRGVKLPGQFWKVLLLLKNGKLSASAYLLSQKRLISNLRDEAFSDNGAVAHFQVPLHRLEERTGLDFHNLRQFDPLSAHERMSAAIHIRSYRDLQL